MRVGRVRLAVVYRVIGGTALADNRLTEAEYDAFREFLARSSGIVLGEQKHYLVVSRLSRLARDAGLGSLSELLARLPRDRALAREAIEAMTTNETSWFRDRHPYMNLRDHILPELGARSRSLRVWSAACSSGQEPYSISIMVDESQRMHPLVPAPQVQIVGTDVAERVIRDAQSATYDRFSMGRGIDDELRARYFVQHGETWELNARIKSRVSFRVFNLLESYAALGRFDVIFCRNVLIYFSAATKEDVLRRLAQALNPGGYLMLGAAETIGGAGELLELVRFGAGSGYRRRA
ncbi:MAG: protein-glutamate O-methyltransferase CheR [Acidihalobacter sp.]|jgi:chemotaxis protein methyltransferase CheR|uniref:CheR family methyltransferase n=1 Tax=Acidihalobacter sp. TaxID=1872108 RepID=UPI00307D953A